MIEIPGYNYPVCVGYVSIPSDVDRQVYIASCYQTGTVSLRTEDNAFFNRVPISEDLLDRLVFPETLVELGSTVLCVNEPQRNQMFAVAILLGAEQIKDLQEGQFKLNKKDLIGKTSVEITGSAKEKYIGITVNTESEEGGIFYLQVNNKSKTAKVVIDCQGSTELQSYDSLSLKSFKEVTVSSLDREDEEKISSFHQTPTEQLLSAEKTTIQNKETLVDTESFKIGKGDHAMTLGDLLKTEIQKEKIRVDTIIQAIANAPVSAGDGGASFKSALVAALQGLESGSYENILSSKSYTE